MLPLMLDDSGRLTGCPLTGLAITGACIDITPNRMTRGFLLWRVCPLRWRITCLDEDRSHQLIMDTQLLNCILAHKHVLMDSDERRRWWSGADGKYIEVKKLTTTPPV